MERLTSSASYRAPTVTHPDGRTSAAPSRRSTRPPAARDSHPRLPLDPDQPERREPARPHAGFEAAAVVAAGGAAGAALRYGLTLALPLGPAAFPLATLLINAGGSGLLGLLLEVVVERAPAWSRRAVMLRHLLGVGLLGALTTYSTFAVDVDLALRRRPATAVWDVGLTLAVGLLACAAGIAVGRRVPLPPRWAVGNGAAAGLDEAS